MSSEEDEWGWEEDEEENDWYASEQVPDLSRGVSYILMSEKDISERQMQAIAKVSDLLGFTNSQAAALLMKYDWNPQLVCQRVTDSRFDDIAILDRKVSFRKSNESQVCIVCCSIVKGFDMRGLDCGHMFCKNCYTGYLTEKLNEGVASVFAPCPMDGCKMIVPEELFQDLLPAQLFQRYKRFLLRSFVDNRQTVKWCPAPGCQYAVEYPKMKAKDIICKCGYSWCFKCGKEAHRPLDCEKLNKWNERNSGVGMTGEDDWLIANTKQCPSCKVRIQKNQGCMHMTCKCGYQFCWLCGGNWTDHGESTGGYYKCNKFEAKQKRGELNAEERKRALAAQSTQRYEHYFNRFMEHKSSIRFAKEKKSKMIASVDMMKQILSGYSNDFNFIVEICDLIISSRTSLCYSYPLGFFLTSPSKLRFFEFMQGELENSLDKLDEFTDKNLDSYVDMTDSGCRLTQEFFNYRSDALRLSGVVKEHINKCLTEMENGFPDIVGTDERGRSEEDLAFLLEDESLSHWICSSCTYANEKGKTVCDICQTARPTLRN